MVVSACSPVLRAMMSTDMVEATKQQVTLNNMPSAVMELLIEYMYRGEINIPPELLLPSTEACDYLQLLELRARCLHQAPNIINSSNAISWHKLADSLNIDELKNKCSEILSSLLADVSKGTEFLELSFAEVSSCISGAQETGDNDDLLEATTNWVAHKPQNRQDHILAMFEKIDLTRCSVECLDTEMNKHKELLCAQPAALVKLTQSLIHIASQPSGNTRQKRSKRGHKDAMIVVIPGHDGNNTQQSDCWNLDDSINFADLCKLAFCCCWHSVCQIPGGFVVSGGQDNNLCAMFILSTKTWKQLEPLPAVRFYHASTFLNGKIYLFGGFISGTGSSSVISLELEGGKWNQEPNIPITATFAEVAYVDSSIFLLDGCYSQQLLRLDMLTKTWSTKTKPSQQPKQNFRARMISAQGQLFVAGGTNKVLACYNPSTDTWTRLNAPTLNHEFGALVHHGQKLYLIGGHREDGVEEYDLETKIWSICDVKLQKKTGNLHAFAISDLHS